MLPIATVFDGVASQYPEAVAVQFEKWDFWTYVQLQKASVQIAKALGGLIAHGQQVAVLLPRSPAQIAAILAILRLGGAYVAINAGSPLGAYRTALDQSD